MKIEGSVTKIKKKTIIAIVLGIFIIIGVIGVTYAYFSTVAKSTPQIITTSNMNLEIETKKPTHITGILPTNWSEFLTEVNNNTNITKIPFTISSTSKVNGAWSINLKTYIPANLSIEEGAASDIKYKIYQDNKLIKEGSLDRHFDKTVLTGNMTYDEELNDSYMLYVYIEETNKNQDNLANIDFNVQLVGQANQTD